MFYTFDFDFATAAIRNVHLVLIRCVYSNHLRSSGAQDIHFFSFYLSLLQPKKMRLKGHLMLGLIWQGCSRCFGYFSSAIAYTEWSD